MALQHCSVLSSVPASASPGQDTPVLFTVTPNVMQGPLGAVTELRPLLSLGQHRAHLAGLLGDRSCLRMAGLGATPQASGGRLSGCLLSHGSPAACPG